MGKFQRWLTASDLVITIISMDSSDEVGKLRKSGMSAATLYGKEEPGMDSGRTLRRSWVCCETKTHKLCISYLCAYQRHAHYQIYHTLCALVQRKDRLNFAKWVTLEIAVCHELVIPQVSSDPLAAQ